MPSKKALIVVDMSKEQVASVDYRVSKTIQNIHKLVTSNVFDRCFDSRLWIDNSSQTSLRKLYSDVGSSNTPGAELIESLREANLEHVIKLNYSCFFGTQLLERLQDHDIKDVYVCGINRLLCICNSSRCVL
uniref:Isochorismatase-like domain-containing protein n=1 Tax=Aplanochytrium stocchinoi TaxID=215587 RepID=A0A7S3PF54_9STRA|mmetsp:Transcript_12704/g.15767  ORF Transcript_12704/g.15767 Transcript_12704/m.15767 type:complete len:132 (+) Transcript_12704:158-553(+)